MFETERKSTTGAVLVAVIAIAVLFVNARSYLPFISDDALISLRYSDRLLDGHGLTWTQGPRVEGYTNLLWVLACSLLGLLGVDLIDASRFWGYVGMAAALAAVAYAYRPRRMGDSVGGLAGAVCMALTAPMAVWTIGGMEQPFVAALLAWATVLAMPLVEEAEVRWRQLLLPGLFLGLMCLTRADGAVPCIGLGLGCMAARRFDRKSWKLVLGLALWPVVMGGAQVLFRLWYYGEWLPNPARVKVAFTSARITAGLLYLREGTQYLAALLVPALISIGVGLAIRVLRRRTILLTVQLVLWCGYVAVIGGDIFPAHRHFVPTIVLAGLLVASLASWMAAQSDNLRTTAWVGAALAGLLILATQSADPEIDRAVKEKWEWDGQRIGEMMRTAFGRSDVLLACDPAGCIPYFSKLNCIDMMGLNDYHIARHKTKDFGKGVLGHELGDGKYVLDRQPDLVLWTRPTGASNPMFLSAIEMAEDPRFAQQYRFVFLETPGSIPLTCGLFVRADSEKIGLRTLSDRMEVPGLLAATNMNTPAVLDDLQRLGVRARKDAAAVLPSLGVPPGRWQVAVEADSPTRLRFRLAGRPDVVVEATDQLELNVPAPGASFDVEFSPATGESVHVRQITFFPRP